MYLTLLFAMSGKATFNDKIDDPYKPDALKGVDRKEIKAIINSAIGSGNKNQRIPTGLIRDAGIDQKRLTELRKLILPAFECLGLLKKGVCDSESLAVHETEIMMRVVEHLQEPIYILHDCLIGQRDRALHIGRALQDKFEAYCLEQGWMPVKPAFSIEDIVANGNIEKVNYSGLIVR